MSCVGFIYIDEMAWWLFICFSRVILFVLFYFLSVWFFIIFMVCLIFINYFYGPFIFL